MNNRFKFLARSVTIGCALVLAGCTTNTKEMSGLYDDGRFADAAIAGDEAFEVLRVADGSRIRGFKNTEDRDMLWLGMEKGKILSDAGRFDDAVDVYQHVFSVQDHLSDMETLFAENPLDGSSWDAGQFLEDIGQAVMGADQTTYVVQPYEAILLGSYASLSEMMADRPYYAAFARQSMQLQGEWRENLQLEKVGERRTPIKAMDDAMESDVGPDVDLGEFSIARILNFDQFSLAKSSMRSVVADAEKAGISSPFVPFASLINWAAFTRSGAGTDAATALRGFRDFSGRQVLADRLGDLAAEGGDKVLVLVGAGRGPTRDSFSVRIPIPIPDVGNGYFRGVYPILDYRGRDTRPSSITVGSQRLEIIDSVDALATQNFMIREPELWWRPTFRGVTRAVAAIIAQAVDDESDSLLDLIALGANVILAEAEQPDLRMWTSLPALHYAGLVDRPADGNMVITITSETGTGTVSVDVPEGLSLVYVRSLEPGLTSAHATLLQGR